MSVTLQVSATPSSICGDVPNRIHLTLNWLNPIILPLKTSILKALAFKAKFGWQRWTDSRIL